MISSPCRYCENKDLPKEICIKECKLIDEIQRFLFSVNDMNRSSGIDVAEEFRVADPSGRMRFNGRSE